MKHQRNDRKPFVFEHGTVRELNRDNLERAEGGSLIPIGDDPIGEPWTPEDPWGGGSNLNC